MIYIYLNTYANGYLYVGSHTWDGEGLDPNYHGSSAIAQAKNWIPIKEEILEVVTDEKFLRERYWIEKYAELYGIADCAAMHKKSKWALKFKQHGRLLNCHANDASQAHMAHAKSVETQKCKGCYKRHGELLRSKEFRDKINAKIRSGEIDLTNFTTAGQKAAMSLESRVKRSKSLLANEGWIKDQARKSNIGNSKESRAKASKTRLNHAKLYRELSSGLEGPISHLRKINPSLEVKAYNHFKLSDEPFVWSSYVVIKIN